MTTGHSLEDGEVTVEMWGKLMADQLQVYLLKRINLAMVNKSPDTIYVLPVLKWIMISLGQAQIRMDNIACQSLASSPPGVMPQNMKFNPFPLAAERTSPIPKPGPLIEAHVDGEILLVGHLEEAGDFAEYFQADDALVDVTGRGLFVLEREGLFTFLLHAPSITALVDHLAAEWLDAIVPEGTIERATALMGESGEGKEIVLREIVRISRYRSVDLEIIHHP